MSDLYMYELEDNVWDDFGATDDHIVPHTADEYGGRKKPRYEVLGVTSDADSWKKFGILREKEKGLHILTKNRMLEKDPWSRIHDSLFPTSGDNDSLKDGTSMASDDPRMSSHGLETGNIDSVGNDLCADDPILVDKCAPEDNNDYHFPLNHITAADDDLRFFNNNHEDKENSDLLYYGWGDIGNFEDVDRMFRSCDSTFGLGGLSNEDDMCWFSSSQVAEGSQGALKADAKLNGLQECPTSRSASAESESKDGSTPSEQISPQEKHSKQHRASGERKDQHLENGGSFTQYDNIKQFADAKHPFSNSSCQLFSSLDVQRSKLNDGPDSVNYRQTNIPYMHLSYSGSLDQVSICPTVSSAKSENNGQSSSKNESSYASNQVHSIESSHGPLFEASAITKNEKRGKLHSQQDTQIPHNRNVKQAKTDTRMAFCDPVTIQKQVCMSEQDEGHSEVEGVSVGNPAELDSSNVRESSCVVSPFDEVSLEATSFRQLQQVMEKLDIRTKLCIRDSLYRLARSAEQRHNCTKTKSGIGDGNDRSGSSASEETNRCTGFMDMETDTNPIDRSIAHLLFHRPSDPSQRPVTDTALLKSHGKIHGSITNPPLVMPEKVIGHEETDAVSDKKVPTNSNSR
ncbi:protein LNK1-like isoform X2 [Gossypium arboreum]|uniref:protein LNK1-like isoform X2 n=1 Tax=Gossypium arboreum TaxID=29729 RepID=UPI0008197A92|nr:protein LNK1-like isoform X2 [Gossypium arboreum]